MELEITWARAVRVWWALLWRNILAILAAMVIGGVVGGILGFVLGMAGVSVETIGSISALLGGIIGLAVSIVPVKLVLGKKFSEFRLVLISENTEAEGSA